MHQYVDRRSSRQSPIVGSTTHHHRLSSGGGGPSSVSSSTTPYRRSPCVGPVSTTADLKQHSASPLAGSTLGRKYCSSPFASSAGYGGNGRDSALGGRVTPSPSSRLTPIASCGSTNAAAAAAKDAPDSTGGNNVKSRASRYDSHFSSRRHFSNDIDRILANIDLSASAAINRYLPSASGSRKSSIIDANGLGLRDSSYPGASRQSPLPHHGTSSKSTSNHHQQRQEENSRSTSNTFLRSSSSSNRNNAGGNGSTEISAGLGRFPYTTSKNGHHGNNGSTTEKSAGLSGLYSTSTAKNARGGTNINLALNEKEKSTSSTFSTKNRSSSSFYSPSAITTKDERGNRSSRGRISPAPQQQQQFNSASNVLVSNSSSNNSSALSTVYSNKNSTGNYVNLDSGNLPANKDKLSSSSYAARLAEDYERVKNRFGNNLNTISKTNPTNRASSYSSSHVTSSGRDQSKQYYSMTDSQSTTTSNGGDGALDGRRSRSAATSPPPGGGVTTGGRKTSWAKHYNVLSSQWAENTGSTLSVSKDQYSYKPITSTQRVDSSKQFTVDLKAPKNFSYSASGTPISKNDESDDYDDESSDEQNHNSSKASGKFSSSGLHRRPRSRRRSASSSKKSSSAMHSPAIGATTTGRNESFDPNSKLGKKSKELNEEANKSSSDEDLAAAGHGSIDARIKARRRRLQKSRAMLQEQKEDSWGHRRYLQLEETKQKAHETSVNPQPHYHNQNRHTDMLEQRRQERRSNSLLQQSLDRVSSMVPSFSDVPKSTPDGRKDPVTCFNVEKIHKTSLQPSWRTTTTTNTSCDSTANTSDYSQQQSAAIRTVRGSTTPVAPGAGVALIVGSSKRAKDFSYNEYVSSIAPKKENFSTSMNYENDPTIALMETERELAQQAAALAKKSGLPPSTTVKDQSKVGKVFQNQLIANFDVTSTFPPDSSIASQQQNLPPPANLSSSTTKTTTTLGIKESASPSAKKLIEMFERTTTTANPLVSDSSMTSSVINGVTAVRKITPNSELSHSLHQLSSVASAKSRIVDLVDSSDARKSAQPDKNNNLETVEIHWTAHGRGKLAKTADHVTHILFERQPIRKEYALFETSLLLPNQLVDQSALKKLSYPVAKPRKSIQQQPQKQQEQQQNQQLLIKREKPKVKILSITQKETIIDKEEKVEDQKTKVEDRNEKVEHQKKYEIVEKKRDFSPKIVALVTEEIIKHVSPPAVNKKSTAADTILLHIKNVPDELSTMENTKKVEKLDKMSTISPKISTVTGKIEENLPKFDKNDEKIAEPKMSFVLFDRQKPTTASKKSNTNASANVSSAKKAESNNLPATARTNSQLAKISPNSTTITTTTTKDDNFSVKNAVSTKISTKTGRIGIEDHCGNMENNKLLTSVKRQQQEKLLKKSQSTQKNQEKSMVRDKSIDVASKKNRHVPKDSSKSSAASSTTTPKRVDPEKIDGAVLKSPVSKRKAMATGQASTTSKTVIAKAAVSSKRTPAADNDIKTSSTLVVSSCTINNDVSPGEQQISIDGKHIKNLKHNVDGSKNLDVYDNNEDIMDVKNGRPKFDDDSNLIPAAYGLNSKATSNSRVSSKSPSKTIIANGNTINQKKDDDSKTTFSVADIGKMLLHSGGVPTYAIEQKQSHSPSTISINSLLQIDHHPPETKISVRVVESSPEPGSKRPFKNKSNEARKLDGYASPYHKYATSVESITATWPPKKHSDQDSIKFHHQNLTIDIPDNSNNGRSAEEQHSSARNLVVQLKKIEEQQKKSQSPSVPRGSLEKYGGARESHEKSLPTTDPSVYSLHRLPSVDREMLQLLTLGEEMCASRSSLHTAYSRSKSPPPSEVSSANQKLPISQIQPQVFQQPIKTTAKIAPTNQKRAVTKEQPISTDVTLSESSRVNSINSLPKPWRGPALFFYDRDGSTDSLASFATANSQMVGGSKESVGSHDGHLCDGHQLDGHSLDSGHQRLPLQQQKQQQQQQYNGQLNGHNSNQKPESLYRKALRRLNEKENSTEPMLLTTTNSTFVKSGSHQSDVCSTSSKGQQGGVDTTKIGGGHSSLDHASYKVDEMLRIARAKHKEERIRFKKAADELDKVCESMAQEFPASSVKYHQGSIDRKRDKHRAIITPGPWTYDKMKSYSFSSRDTMAKNGHEFHAKAQQGLDESKLDYTKRWLEGDLKSLAACDPKPDLLQFGSQCRIEADQHSIGSASAEVAAITNKDRLHALRVPDIVPRKCELLKPAPVHVQQHLQSLSPSNFSYNFHNAQADKQAVKAQIYKFYKNEVLANGQLPDSNSRRQLAEHIQACTNGSTAVAGSSAAFNNGPGGAGGLNYVLPKKEFGGLVKKQVDMFDKMGSDNESERSFLSDNVAYRNILPVAAMTTSGRVSLTDNMTGFVRKFESEDALQQHGGGHSARMGYGHGNGSAHSYASEQARLETCKRGVKKVFKLQAQTTRRPSGSTQSLPVLVSGGSQQQHYHSNKAHEKQQHNLQPKTDLMPEFASWHTTSNGLAPDKLMSHPYESSSMYHQAHPPSWSSKSTLRNEPVSSTTPKHRNSMQNVDNIVAELTLNVDHHQTPQHSMIHHNKFPTLDNSKKSVMTSSSQLSGFPVDYQMTADNGDSLQVTSGQQRKQSANILNVIPEYTEHYENIQYAGNRQNKPDGAYKSSMTSYPTSSIVGQSHSANELLKKRDQYVKQLENKDNSLFSASTNSQAKEPTHSQAPPVLPPRTYSSNYVLKPIGQAQMVLKNRQSQRTSWHEPSLQERTHHVTNPTNDHEPTNHYSDQETVGHVALTNKNRAAGDVIISSTSQAGPPPTSTLLHSPKFIKINNVMVLADKKVSSDYDYAQINHQSSAPNTIGHHSSRKSRDQNNDVIVRNPIKNLLQIFNRGSSSSSSASKNDKNGGSGSNGDAQPCTLQIFAASSAAPATKKQQRTPLPIKSRAIHKSHSSDSATGYAGGRMDGSKFVDQSHPAVKPSADIQIAKDAGRDLEKQRKFKLGNWSLFKR